MEEATGTKPVRSRAGTEAAEGDEPKEVVPRGSDSGRILRWRSPKPGRYGDAFDRALDRAVRRNPGVARERASAAHKTRSLLEQPSGRRSLLLGNHPEFGGWWLAAMLADEADARQRNDAGAAVQLARLATEVAHRIDGDPPPADAPEAPLVEDVTARSWRALADALLRNGEVDSAALALARARRHLRRGTREPLERAALLESTGRLLAARGRRRARTFYRAAAALFDDLGEDHQAGRCRLRGLLLQEVPEDEAERRLHALELRQGLGMLDAVAEPELASAGRRRLASLAETNGLPALSHATPQPLHPDLPSNQPSNQHGNQHGSQPSPGPTCGLLSR